MRLQYFWCVKVVVNENGEKEVSLSGREEYHRPRDTSRSRREYNTSSRWFDAKEEAEIFYAKEAIPKIIAPPPQQAESPLSQYKLLSVQQVMKVLNVGRTTAHDMAKSKEITPVYLHGGNIIRFHPKEIEDYIFYKEIASSPFELRPKDKEELFRRLDERHESLKCSLENIFSKSKKGGVPCKK
jgi:predicted DNA-binding transcriptional regulator AlpA